MPFQYSKNMTRPVYEKLTLYFSMLVIGGCGLAYEYTLSKLSSDLLGDSKKQWALTIAIMMFCMGIGADVQKYFLKKIF